MAQGELAAGPQTVAPPFLLNSLPHPVPKNASRASLSAPRPDVQPQFTVFQKPPLAIPRAGGCTAGIVVTLGEWSRGRGLNRRCRQPWVSRAGAVGSRTRWGPGEGWEGWEGLLAYTPSLLCVLLLHGQGTAEGGAVEGSPNLGTRQRTLLPGSKGSFTSRPQINIFLINY